ncbi:MAG: hypothetical protein RL681_683 [Candidatus Parcubacteria bacterium]|jgi:predicted Zn-dependent peptidase
MPKTPATIKHVLPNGLRVVLVPQPGSVSSAVLVLVEAGSEYEKKRTNGLSHFLEHMMFKGTTKRPTSQLISSELDSLGAEYNAFTGQEYTGYWAKAQNAKLSQIMDIVFDMYLHPIFDPKEIEKERGVVIEEINLYEDTPTRQVHQEFSELLYGDQPAGWDIAGTKQNIRTLQRKDFVTYRDARYVAPGTAVIIAGAFDPKRVLKTVQKQFGSLERRRAPKKPRAIERQSRPAVRVKFKESDQTHIVLGTRAFSMFDKRRYALQVLADVAGGGMSSRLFHRVREDLGAAYYVRASADLSLDRGFFSVSAGSDNKRAPVVVKAILEELDRLRRELVPVEELQKAKDHLVGGLMLGLETSDQLAGFYGSQEITTKKLVSPAELNRKVQGVTAEEIRIVARAIFTDRSLNLALIGPWKKETPFRKILKF